MRLIDNWRRILRYAWSVRLAILSGMFYGMEAVLPLYIDSMPRNVFAILAVFCAAGSAVARFISQPKIERRRAPRPSESKWRSISD